MKKDRDIDRAIAQKILGHRVFIEKTGAIRESLESGQSRPLRNYTVDISAAWEVVEKLSMTLLPVDSGWFALVGKGKPWSSPAEFLVYLQKADFTKSGAAVSATAPMTICLAALNMQVKEEDKDISHKTPARENLS